MAKRNSNFFAGILASTFALLVCFSGTAQARPLFEQHYGEEARRAGKAVQGDYTDGYRPKVVSGKEEGRRRGVDPLDVAITPGEQINPASGSIVVQVKYTGGKPVGPNGLPDDYNDTLFAVSDSAGNYLMNTSVVWGEAVPSWFMGAGKGAVRIDVDGDLWGRWLPFDRNVKEGEWLTFTFTWDNGVNRAFVNGKELTERYVLSYDNSSVVDGRGDFAPIAARIAKIRFGADFEEDNRPLVAGAIGGIAILDRAIVPSAPKPVIASVSDDSFQVPGISGKLVAGDTVKVTLVAEANGTATFDMGSARGIPLAPVPPSEGGNGVPPVLPGTYQGSYTVRPGDDFEDGRIVGRFVSDAGVEADPVSSSSKWTIVTKPAVTFAIDNRELPADTATKTRVRLVAKDANGNPLQGRHLKLTLATTDEYTGLVGAGDFGKEVGGTVETRWKGDTDAWGEVEFEYTAGFAAKTAILQAKDLDSGGVSVEYIRSFKEASIDIALTAPRSLAAARRGTAYTMKIEASRTELTADGRSRSVIRATVLDPGGAPAPGEPVAFTLSSPNGTLRTIVGTTDGSGTATAEYTAGKKMGIVVITATDTVRNISASVSITLLADAPAKILLKARPEALPADGSSRANIQVKVTDINDNPNENTLVEFRLAKGSGTLESPSLMTDRYGDAVERFTAGTTPGIATIVATVRSRVPSEAELAKAKNVLFVPYNEQEEAIRVDSWLRKKGDKVLQGEGIVTYTVGRGGELHTLVAPFDLTVDEILVEYWDNAEIGQSLAIVSPVIK